MTSHARFPSLRRFGATPVLIALALATALPAVAEEETTNVRLRQVDVRRVLLAGEGGSAAGLFISRTAEDGGETVTRLQVLGSDHEEISLDDIALGETQSFQLEDGRWLDVTREEDSLLVDLDGKEIAVPLTAPPDDIAALGGDRDVRVFMMRNDDTPVGAGQFFLRGDDAAITFEESEDATWTDHDGNAVVRKGRVVIKTLGGDAGTDGDLRVLTLPAFPLSGLPVTDEQLEGLESLEGADPATRAKVLEALREILAGHSAIELETQVNPTRERRVEVR